MTYRTDHSPAQTESAGRNPDFVDALAKGLQILASFERAASLSNGELAELTGFPKATVSRLTGTLVTLGYLQRDEDSRKYVIGSRVLGLGATIQRHMRLQRAARPLMEQLAGAHDLSIVLGTRDGTGVLLLEVARPPRNRLTLNSDIGSRVPLASTALGLACLVGSPLRERARLIGDLQRSSAGDWTGMREQVERAHEERSRKRFILSLESRGGTLAAAAVPLVLERVRVFALAAVGPAFELSRPRLTRTVGPQLADMVDRLARSLGGSAASHAQPARVPRRQTP